MKWTYQKSVFLHTFLHKSQRVTVEGEAGCRVGCRVAIEVATQVAA